MAKIDDVGSLIRIFQAAADHHDTSKPDVTHDLGSLSNQAKGVGGGGLIELAIEHPEAVLAILAALRGLADKLFEKRKKAQEPVSVEAPKPGDVKVFKEPEPPPTAGAQWIGSLEAWPEDAWHDWQKSDENPDGQFNPAIYLDKGQALPPAPSIWYLGGVQPGEGGHARIPQNEPDTVFPEAIHHFQWDNEEIHSFSSNHQIDGGTQPIPEIGHVQGGPKWQKSNGWGFILRVKGHHAPGPKTLKWWFEAGGKTSNVVEIPISHSANG